MASSLPENPSLEGLLAQAHALHRDGRTLRDAQLTLARGYGFTDWPAVVRYLEVAADLTVDPSSVADAAAEPADRFCVLSSLLYNHFDAPPRWAAARQLLDADPDLVRRHVWAAASACDPEALSWHLRDTPASAGGPLRWDPLLYLCYSRVPVDRSQDEVLAAARVLLDAGADPNAGYLWCGMSTPFTALTGVFGEGEQGVRRQPRHRYAPALASLLLEGGAHPVDQQALYNRMFSVDDSHLELLFAHGLADAGPSPWERRLGEAMETRAQMWRRQIEWAAEHGFGERLRLLADRGVDVSGVHLVERVFPAEPNARDAAGATALHHAAWAGDLDLIRQLLDAGADPGLADHQFGSTPLGWAEHAYQTEAAALLRTVGR